MFLICAATFIGAVCGPFVESIMARARGDEANGLRFERSVSSSWTAHFGARTRATRRSCPPVGGEEPGRHPPVNVA